MLFYEITNLKFIWWLLMLRVVFSVCFLFATNVYSADKDKEAIQLSITAGDITGQRKHIENNIVGSEYKEMDSEDRADLLIQLQAVDSGSLSVEEMTRYQNNINSILKTAYANSKLVCTREKPLGSQMAVKVCKTVAEKKNSEANSQQTLKMQ